MLLLILLFILYVILWSLPLYFVTNLVLWLFHLTFRITLLQSVGLGFLLSVIQNYILGGKK